MQQNIVKVGQKFNKLTIINILLDKKNREAHKVECICDCGSICIRNLRCVKRGISRSCGCLMREWHKSDKFKEMQKKSSKMGANATRLEYGQSSFNRLIRSYKWHAKNRKLSFELTNGQFKVLVDGPCYYCRVEASQVSFNKNDNGEYIYNGIDRVNNSKGYSVDNCVSCCGSCNEMKMGRDKEEFLNKIKDIYENHFNGKE